MLTAIIVTVSQATRAVFSTSDNIPGNTISTARVSLDAHNFSGNKPIGSIVEKLVPGQWTQEGRAELYNTGDAALRVYMHVEDVAGEACDKVNLKVFTGWAGGDEHVRTVYDYNINWLLTNRVEVTGDPPFATLLPNWSQVIWQKAQLDSSADNGYQGKSCTWNEVFYAESVAPTPAP